MNNEHLVHVIKTVSIFVVKEEFEDKHYATIYDGGTHLNTTYGKTYNEAHDEAVKWVYDNFNVPTSIEMLTYRQPEEVEQYYDEATKLRERNK